MEEFCCKIFGSPRLPRVTLVPNFQHVQKDVHVSGSRKSDDREKDQHREACGSEYCIDFRIPGIPHSAVEQVETNRKEKVREPIEHFENYPNRNMLLKDFKKSEETNHFSRESKDLITEIGNLEIFFETSSKRQCSDCAICWEIGMVFCTCGKCLLPTSMNRPYNRDRFDTLSIPGYVMKKNQSRGPRQGQAMRQILYHKSTWYVEKSQTSKERFMQNDSGKMAHRCRLSQVALCWRLDRGEN